MSKIQKTSAHLQYFWWVYVLIAVLVIFAWTTAFSIMAKPRDNEQVTVIFFDRSFDAKGMNAVANTDIASITAQKLKEITFGTADYGDELTFMQQMSTRLYGADIIILPENIIKADDISAWFKPIPEAVAKQYFADAQLYRIDGEIYGVCVYPAENSLVSEHYSGEQAAVAFFSPQSENLGALYGKGDAADAAAFDVAAYILGGD